MSKRPLGLIASVMFVGMWACSTARAVEARSEPQEADGGGADTTAAGADAAAQPARALTAPPGRTLAAAMSEVIGAGMVRPARGEGAVPHEVCVAAFDHLVSKGQEATPYLMAALDSERKEERLLAMWLLGLLPNPGQAIEDLVIGIATDAWTKPLAACIADETAKRQDKGKGGRPPEARCRGRLAGGRPPAKVRLACETLFRMK